jgi:ATP-GRASP peptide maturase of grasp-with-spasm system
MVAIFSFHTMDYSTEEVADWIQYLGQDVLRINGIDLLNREGLSLSSNEVDEDDMISGVKLADIDAIWYRRWIDYGAFDDVPIKDDSRLYSQINAYRRKEFNSLTNALKIKVRNIKSLGHGAYGKSGKSKFEQSLIAQSIGINIPDTIITDNKETLIQFLEKNNNSIITKGINNLGSFTINKDLYSTYTTIITSDDLEYIPEEFFPSMFQEKLEKTIELRVFYLHGKFFTMAIFSQNDSQTSVDFRKYNYNKPNRKVPYTLPKDIEDKLTKLMKTLNLDTGSIDIVISKDTQEYYFLEVNPAGQFGMVSFPCNFNIEKKIAKFLMKENN